MKKMIFTAIFLLSFAPVYADDIYDITVSDSVDMMIVSLDFKGRVPPPETVDLILKSALELTVGYDDSRPVMGAAFVRDSALSDAQYSGQIVWRPDTNAISPVFPD